MPVKIPNHLVWAILATIFCCLPLGIVAIVYAAQVNGKVATGDYAGAQASAGKAKMWIWIGFGVGLAIQIVVVAINVIVGFQSF
ncbi:MAG: CD225/dispanin family protein [Pseudomonadota bacterium]